MSGGGAAARRKRGERRKCLRPPPAVNAAAWRRRRASRSGVCFAALAPAIFAAARCRREGMASRRHAVGQEGRERTRCTRMAHHGVARARDEHAAPPPRVYALLPYFAAGSRLHAPPRRLLSPYSRITISCRLLPHKGGAVGRQDIHQASSAAPYPILFIFYLFHSLLRL